LPPAVDPPTDCPFQTRCPRKIGAICETEAPPVRVLGDGHRITCHLDTDTFRTMEPVITMDTKAA